MGFIHPTRSAAALIMVCLLALHGVGGAFASMLREAAFEDAPGEALLTLRFQGDPPIRYTPMTGSRILILDFGGAVLPSNQQRFTPQGGLVEFLSLSPFAGDRLRLLMKVTPGTLVNVFKYPPTTPGEVRYAVSVGRDRPVKRQASAPRRKTRPRVVIDPGHGGHDNGARGSVTTDKAVGLAVALEAKKLFDADPRLEAYFTRLDDVFVALEERSDFARRVQADCFVSLHANWMPRNHSTEGVEVWYLSDSGAQKEIGRALEDTQTRGPSVRGRSPVRRRQDGVDQIILSMQQSRTIQEASTLAQVLERRIPMWTGQPTKGVKRGNFKVLRPIDIPSCLIEFGFLSNFNEQRLLATKEYHRRAARALYEGVVEWMLRTGRIRPPPGYRPMAIAPRPTVPQASHAAPPVHEEETLQRVASASTTFVQRARQRLRDSHQ